MFAGGKRSRNGRRQARLFVAFSAVMAVSIGGVAVASACGIGTGQSPLPISSKCPTTTTTAPPTNGSLHQSLVWGGFNSKTRLSAWQRFFQQISQRQCGSTTTTTLASGGDGGGTTTVPPTTVQPVTTTTAKPATTTTVKSTTTTVKPTTTTVAPTNSNCTNPTFTSSDAEGTDGPLDNNDVWWVNNDAWSGSHGPQTINVCSQTSWNAVSTQPDNGGQVETYPDTEYDVNGRGNATKTIAQYNSITSTFSEQFPAQGSWDAAYDLWLNDWSTEIMVWNEWSGAQAYWPQNSTQAVTLNGVPYHFTNNGGELMFFRDSQVKSGSVDILAAFQWLESQGLVKSTDVPTQLEYGVEVCSTTGSETFPMTGLTFSLS